MEKIKKRWDIVKNWQLVFPIIGFLLTLATGYYFARKVLHLIDFNNTPWEWPITLLGTCLLTYLLLKFFLWCFQKLKNKWVTQYRWEMIAIFIVFAITGSLSARLAAPLVHLLGLDYETSSGWLYWPVRILIIFPIYQLLLVAIGWLFGQFQFFWAFEKRMLKKMRLGFLIP
ncbi:prolipoprotein diacylglyceryl transferase [Croceivirga radicis]|uniref:Prolipoprotein diacylglyceryl transferase n=1 Tax=Croceivirga radicis TaxID=1929488 RepID=A0A1V6LRW6_9FLAO|nr:DUF6787 family protein [Croceivirga radicis]OQD42931.1 prolipoprotein diacylglyceryl transferase [Croceivirga radicis]